MAKTDHAIALEFWKKGYYRCWEDFVDFATELDENGMTAMFNKKYGKMFDKNGKLK